MMHLWFYLFLFPTVWYEIKQVCQIELRWSKFSEFDFFRMTEDKLHDFIPLPPPFCVCMRVCVCVCVCAPEREILS